MLAKRPELRRDVASAKGPRGLVTRVRQLVLTLSQGDSIRVHLSFGLDGRPLDAHAGLGADKLVWADTLNKLRVTVTGAGETHTLTAAGTEPSGAKPAPLAWLAERTLHIGPKGITDRRQRSSAPWSQPPAALFSKPGRYTFKIAGTLELESGPLPFETAELEVEVKADGELMPLAELEAKASDSIKSKVAGLKQAPFPVLPTMQDAAGNRVLRFSMVGV